MTHPSFDDNAQMIWTKQYALHPAETIEEGFARAASVGKDDRTAFTIFEMMRAKKFSPGGRILAGAQTQHRNTNNCYVLSSDSQRFDTLADVVSHTFKLARTTRVGGGIGTNLDPFPGKARAVQPTPKRFILAIRADHPDAANLKAWRFRDVTKPEGQQWIENRPMRAIETVVTYEGESDLNTQLDRLGVRSGSVQHVFVKDSMDDIIRAVHTAIDANADTAVIYLTQLRPEGSDIAGSGGTSSGAASFGIELFDNILHWRNLGGVTAGPVAYLRYVEAPILRVVRQGGVRRGAGMATIMADHEDAPDFLTSKDLAREAAEGDISTYNISFLVTDRFFELAEQQLNLSPDVFEHLHMVEDGIRNEPAQAERMAAEFADRIRNMVGPEGYMLANIALHAWMTGEPGLLYHDAVNRLNPLRDVDGEINCTNPCGEINLYPGEPCDLGALNIAAYVTTNGEQLARRGLSHVIEQSAPADRDKQRNRPVFDWDAFKRDVAHVIDYLDDNLDYCQYPVEDARVMAQRNRRVGAGIMGLADALVKLGLPYGSPDAQNFTRELMREYGHAALKRSEELAELRGEPEWSVLARKAGTIETPRRNVALLTIAPTGTTSMLMGVSSGVEPIYSPFIWRKVGSQYVSILHPLFKDMLEQYEPKYPEAMPYNKSALNNGVYEWDWDAVALGLQTGNGSVQGFDWIPDEIKRVFVFAHDVTAKQHVEMQAAAQQGMDAHRVGNSISKTINMPNEATTQDVLNAYRLAHALHCKGVTVYRDGSRQFQVLSTSKDSEAQDTTEAAEVTEPAIEMYQGDEPGHVFPHALNKPLPNRRAAVHQKISIEGASWYINPGYDEHGRITEVFIAPPKGDAFLSTTASVIGRLISQLLQAGVPIRDVVNTLQGQHDNTGGLMTGLGKGQFVRSVYDAFAVVLEELSQLDSTQAVPPAAQPTPSAHTPGATLAPDSGLSKCPECKEQTFNKAECVCYQCGATRCG
ncbi:adenosylcobalamin-dependent ribonucleoside-diphosphate reductase [Deinococcus kurensis]|uniref:adenosylcobalamin-dependent ribonucleoside-diphosphate reductase n=1 Tax=Deinococcus kurensis TaxID=2662757 RepID=UPI0012D33F0F|nr:adenosylcobalamin-dependent ribonucleoside-diphosphate reductase [Deinococcus kurensis]